MLRKIGTVLPWMSGKWSAAFGKRALRPSVVKRRPGTLLPVPRPRIRSASCCRSIPNWAWPSPRAGPTGATCRSWIIQPSYQPLSLLITNIGSMSVNTSMKARTSFGSVGRSGFGSRARRTEPIVGMPQSAPVTVSITASLIPGKIVVKTLGSNPCVSSR